MDERMDGWVSGRIGSSVMRLLAYKQNMLCFTHRPSVVRSWSCVYILQRAAVLASYRLAPGGMSVRHLDALPSPFYVSLPLVTYLLACSGRRRRRRRCRRRRGHRCCCCVSCLCSPVLVLLSALQILVLCHCVVHHHWLRRHRAGAGEFADFLLHHAAAGTRLAGKSTNERLPLAKHHAR